MAGYGPPTAASMWRCRRAIMPRRPACASKRRTQRASWQTRKQNLGFPEGKVKTIVLRIDDAFHARTRRAACACAPTWKCTGTRCNGRPACPTRRCKPRALPPAPPNCAIGAFRKIRLPRTPSPELPVSYEEVERPGQKWRDLTGYYTRLRRCARTAARHR